MTFRYILHNSKKCQYVIRVGHFDERNSDDGQSSSYSCAAVCRSEQRDRPAQAACWVNINSAAGGHFTIQQIVVENLLHCHFMERDQKD